MRASSSSREMARARISRSVRLLKDRKWNLPGRGGGGNVRGEFCGPVSDFLVFGGSIVRVLVFVFLKRAFDQEHNPDQGAGDAADDGPSEGALQCTVQNPVREYGQPHF